MIADINSETDRVAFAIANASVRFPESPLGEHPNLTATGPSSSLIPAKQVSPLLRQTQSKSPMSES